MVPGEGFNSFRGPWVTRNRLKHCSGNFHFAERYQVRIMAEVFDLFNYANFQQNAVDNVQYTTGDPVPDPSNPTNAFWTATANPFFGQPGAVVPKFGSRSFQFSTRFSF